MNKNLLINGEFNVAQRGTSFDATTTPKNDDDTYLLDRWILLSDGNDIVDVSQVTDAPDGSVYAQKAVVQTANKKFGFVQIIENANCQQVIDSIASLSFQIKTGSNAIRNIRAAVLSWSGTTDTVTSDVVSAWNAEGTIPTLATSWSYQKISSNLSLPTTYQRCKVENIAINSDAKNIAVFIWVDDTDAAVSDELYLGQVQLEKGSAVSDYAYRQIGAELMLSQRYYFQMDSAQGNSEQLFAVGAVTSSGAAHFLVQHPVEMRVVPTRLTSAANTFLIHAPTATTPSSVGFDGVAYSDKLRSQMFALDSGTTLTAGNGGRLSANLSASAYVKMDAEL